MGAIFSATSEPMKVPVRAPIQEHQVYVRARIINGKQRDCLLDSGSEVSLVPTSWVNGLQLSEATTRLLAVNGTEIEASGQLQQSVIVGNQRTTATFLASPNLRVAVLGIGRLAENHVTWLIGENTLVLGQQRVVLR